MIHLYPIHSYSPLFHSKYFFIGEEFIEHKIYHFKCIIQWHLEYILFILVCAFLFILSQFFQRFIY